MEQQWFTGRLAPPAEVVSRNLPRLEGDGALVTGPDGLVVRGRGYMASDPRRTRLLAVLAFAALGVALLFVDRNQLSAVLGVGLGGIVGWALYNAWRDHRGRDVDATVAWKDVARVDANDELVVIVLGEARFLGTPVPNPVFFAPDGGSAELVEQLVRGMDTARG